MKWTVNNERLTAEILAFYDWLETNCMGTSCICLWLALMHTWHKAGCPEEFAVAMSTLEGKTGLKKDAIGDARNRLQQLGRIIWRQRSGRASAVYSVVSFYPTQIISDGITDANTRTNPAQAPAQSPRNPTCDGINATNEENGSFASVKPPISNKSSSSYTDTRELLNHLLPPTTDNVPEIPSQNPAQNACDGITDANTRTNPAQTGFSPTSPVKHYERLFGIMRPMVLEELRDYLNCGIAEDVICLAMDRSHENGAANWNYAKKILDRCVMEKILNMDAFLRAEELHRIKKAQKQTYGARSGTPPPKVDGFAENAMRAVEEARKYASS
ncbi:MAG: DnaD domain protein [Defluviitaleaceae bacterium]|nr:DnaD domain protein [Defluviitaleaceae bacterium]